MKDQLLEAVKETGRILGEEIEELAVLRVAEVLNEFGSETDRERIARRALSRVRQDQEN